MTLTKAERAARQAEHDERIERQVRLVLEPFTDPLWFAEDVNANGRPMSGTSEAFRALVRSSTPEIHMVLRHVSRSGMSRVIDPFVIRDGQVIYLRTLAEAAGFRMHPRMDGVTVGGCGMDMGFHLWSCIARVVERWCADHNEPCPASLVYCYRTRWV